MRYRRNFAWMILAMIGFVFLFILLTMYLWNWLVPDLFNGPQINFWQSAGLLLLAKILFGFGSKSGGWRKYKKDRYSHMSPSEKEALKRKFMERCGIKEEPAGGVESISNIEEQDKKRGYSENSDEGSLG